MQITLYPTITAVSNCHFEKLEEAQKLKIKKLCVFFSPLIQEKRKVFYKALEKSIIKEIPFAHIRGDFTKEEIIYLKKNFNTRLFNFHSDNQHKIFYDYGDLKKEIYIENTMTKFNESEITDYAGICLDVSHLENDRLTNNGRYLYFKNLLKKMNCACGHASALKKDINYCEVAEEKRFDKHFFEKLSDFDYLVKYKKILPQVIALEVENTLSQQLKAIEYINKKLNL